MHSLTAPEARQVTLVELAFASGLGLLVPQVGAQPVARSAGPGHRPRDQPPGLGSSGPGAGSARRDWTQIVARLAI